MRLPLRSASTATHAPTTGSFAAVPAPRPEALRRAEGGPADVATYPCSCGYVFVARVSTSVDCPHCGAGQAW